MTFCLQVFEVADNTNPWTVFLEIESPEKPGIIVSCCACDLPAGFFYFFVYILFAGPLPAFDKLQDVMLFFKYYDPAKEKIYYMGHMYVGITAKMSSVVPELVKRASLPAGTPLSIYEEIRPNYLEKVEDLEKPLEHVLEELMDGDIIVFQKATADGNYR